MGEQLAASMRQPRRERLLAAIVDADLSPDCEIDALLEDPVEPLRYLLLECNVREEDYWASTHDSPEDASAYNAEQSGEEFWAAALIDLDTGQEYAGVVRIENRVAVGRPGE